MILARSAVAGLALFVASCASARSASSATVDRVLGARIEITTQRAVSNARVRVDDDPEVAIGEFAITRALTAGVHHVHVAATVEGSDGSTVELDAEATVDPAGSRMPSDPSLATGCAVDVVGYVVQRSLGDPPTLEVEAIETCHDYTSPIGTGSIACPSADGRESGYRGSLATVAEQMLHLLFRSWALDASQRDCLRDPIRRIRAARDAVTITPAGSAQELVRTCEMLRADFDVGHACR